MGVELLPGMKSPSTGNTMHNCQVENLGLETTRCRRSRDGRGRMRNEAHQGPSPISRYLWLKCPLRRVLRTRPGTTSGIHD